MTEQSNECWISTTHPELNCGECLLANVTRPEFHYIMPQIDGYPHRPDQYYNQLSFKSKRKGDVAYDADGKVYEHLYPIIVNIDEYEQYLIKIGRLCMCRQSTIDCHGGLKQDD